MKAQDLIGPALDWAVAKCEGCTPLYENIPAGMLRNRVGYLVHTTELRYSTDWSLGGPILDREINVLEKRDGYFYAWRSKRTDDKVTIDFKTIKGDREAWAYGPTMLVAGMRAYVKSKLGEEVDIPNELIEENDHGI